MGLLHSPRAGRVPLENKGMHIFQITKKRLANRTAYALLLDDLEQAKYDLALAYSNFENAMEPDLIDCCIYQVNALQTV